MTRKIFLGCVSIIGLWALPSYATEAPWVGADQVRARLFSGPHGQPGLDVELSEGWHSYWRAPGDAGLPPKFDWTKSENVASVDVLWPWPQRFDEMGITTFGYQGSYTFPLLVHMAKPDEKARLNLALDIMVCKDICIPQQLNLSLDVDSASGPAAPDLTNTQGDFAESRIPKTENNPGLSIDTVVTGPDAVVITASAARDLSAADIFVIAGDTALTGKPEITVDAKDNRRAMIKIPKPASADDFAKFLAGKDLDVVLVSSGEAVEKVIKFLN